MFFRLPPVTDFEGGDQPRRSRAERRGEIGGDHAVPEVQGRLEDPGVLAVGEGERRRAEVAPVDQPFVRSGQAVARGGDRHRERVLVVVAHRALPLGDHDDGRGEPAHRLEDRRPLEPQAGDVGAVGSDSDHRLVPPVVHVMKVHIPFVIPAKAGIQNFSALQVHWTPAFAGVTIVEKGTVPFSLRPHILKSLPISCDFMMSPSILSFPEV